MDKGLILAGSKVKKTLLMMDLFLTNMDWHHVDYLWIIVTFYQLFGLSF